MVRKPPDLESAYALDTPDGAKQLYATWAADYDADFAGPEAYVLPRRTAEIFAATGIQGPVLDVGAGTGLCGVALAALGVRPIDATDISTEMLAEALRKDVYRDLIEADLTKGLRIAAESYAGIVSSGTFTTGHVGPDALDEVLRLAKPNAQIALSINTTHYHTAGFADKLAQLAGQIRDLSLPEIRIYGRANTGPHRDDTAFVALFRKR